jgi:hypothetical protein
MTAGISIGDKVITTITTGRSIVSPSFLPSAKRITASVFLRDALRRAIVTLSRWRFGPGCSARRRDVNPQ